MIYLKSKHKRGEKVMYIIIMIALIIIILKLKSPQYKGKSGEFYGCSNYPKCKYTKNI